MPVQKFHSVEEMNEAPYQAAAGGAFGRFVRHCARYRTLAPHSYPRGVFKFRTITDAQRARELVASPSSQDSQE